MRLAVVGTGLIGASAALAARRGGEADAVLGWDEDPEVLEAAAERDAVEPAPSLADALRDADLALVAVPVAGLPGVVQDVLKYLICAFLIIGAIPAAFAMLRGRD